MYITWVEPRIICWLLVEKKLTSPRYKMPHGIKLTNLAKEARKSKSVF